MKNFALTLQPGGPPSLFSLQLLGISPPFSLLHTLIKRKKDKMISSLIILIYDIMCFVEFMGKGKLLKSLDCGLPLGLSISLATSILTASLFKDQQYRTFVYLPYMHHFPY